MYCFIHAEMFQHAISQEELRISQFRDYMQYWTLDILMNIRRREGDPKPSQGRERVAKTNSLQGNFLWVRGAIL